MYPEWDPSMPSGRSGSLLDTPNLSAGLLGPVPMSSAQASGGMSSSWGGDPVGLSGKNLPGQNKLRSRVVVVKYDRKPLSTKTLFAFAEPFGVLRENLVLKNKAFFEMNSHEEAVDMVNYYELHPASLYGKPLTFYLSKRLLVIEKDDRMSDRSMDRPVREVKGYGSQVVFFSNLPREEEKKMELLTIAARFGIVEKHLFLTDQAFVQLGTPEDAEMLVKYYSLNPLTIKGRPIRLNICTKYKTLNVNKRQGGSSGDSRGQRSSRGSTYSSSASGSRTSSSSLRTSSSKSSSSSRSREEKKKEEESKAKPEVKPPVEEEEEVSGVMEGEEEGGEVEEEQVADGDAEEEQPETAETEEEKGAETEEDKQEEVPAGDDVTGDKPEDMGEAEAEAEQGAESETQTAEATETEEPERKEELSADPGESSETMMDESADTLDQDFLENMEDFVTLDELAEDEEEEHEESDSIDNTRKGGMRVVNVVGLRRGYTFMEELMGLAKPFGKVVKHLVLDLKPEAYLQFETEEEARAMAKFYSSNVTASVCGRPVRISHSMSYPTIQCGSSRVVYIGQIPNSTYSDEALLKLAEPFGRVKKYFLNRIKRECFIEMDQAEQAEKMAEKYKKHPQKFNGKYLTIYVSRKYRQLKYGHHCPGPTRRESSSSTKSTKSSRHSEEPPAKKPREEEEKKEEEEEEQQQQQEEERKEEETQSSEVDDKKEENSAEQVPEDSDQNQKMSSEELKQDEEVSTNQNGETEAPLQGAASLPLPPQTSDVRQEEEMETSTNQNGQTEAAPPPPTKPSVASLPLPPHDPDTPIGVEHVKMGYYCRVCFLFYSNEDMAKKTHCSSQAHYDKLQKHLEKEQSKAEKKKGKKTTP